MRKRIVLTLCGGLVLVSAQATTLQEYLGHVKSLRADFTQTVRSSNKQSDKVTLGKLFVKSPDRFRLEYSKPYKQTYVADGKRLWSYDADLEQVTVKAQKTLLANSPAMVLSNPAMLDKIYQVKPDGQHDGMEWFVLTPKSKNNESGFEQVSLGFSNQKLNVFEMLDSFGQRTRLKFESMQYNSDISSSTFTFTPPQGVDVINDTQETP